MAKKNLQQYLYDVILTIDSLMAATVDFKLKDYFVLTNKWMVERGISIVGEAIYKANDLNRKLPITDIKRIIGMRHIIVHDYDKIDEPRLMIIVTNHLPLLKMEVEEIIKSLNTSSPTP